MSHFFCKIGDTELGPFSPDQLKEMAASGDLGPKDFVRRGTDQEWVLARRMKALTFGTIDRQVKKPPPLPDRKSANRKRSFKSDSPIVVDAGDSAFLDELIEKLEQKGGS